MMRKRDGGVAGTSAWQVGGRFTAGLISALVVFSGCQAPGAHTVRASESQISEVHGESERVCLSLRVLATRVSNALAENAPLPHDCARLAGIGFLEGFIVDERGEGDVILVGRRSKALPSLRLDDLIVNMRSVAQAREYPFCSLDPRAEDVRALHDLFRESQGLRSPAEMRAFFARLQSAVGPQQVVIGGVPRNSRHAHVMIDADYHMKKVSQGLIALPAVTSYLDRLWNEARESIQEGHDPPATGMSMARFWFHLGPDCPTFQEDKGIIWLDACRVVVLTEKQMSTASGELHDVEQDDPIAMAFAGDLSRAFRELTASVPVYADLENLFRLRALLLAMRLRGSLSQSGFDSDSYLAQYRFQDETPMARSYPGLANFREWSTRVVRGNMVYEYCLFPMVCGGVGMDMHVADTSFTPCDSLPSRRITELLARPSRDSFAWEVPTKPISLQADESAAVSALQEHCKAADVDAMIVSRARTGVITVLDADGHAKRVTSQSDAIYAAGVMAGPSVERARRVQLFLEGFSPGEGEGIVASWRGSFGDAPDLPLARRLQGIVSKNLEPGKLGDVVAALSNARVNKLKEFNFATFEQASRIWQRPDGTLEGTLTIDVPIGVRVLFETTAPAEESGRFKAWMRKVWECCKRGIRGQFGEQVDPATLHERLRNEIDRLKRKLGPEEEDFEEKLGNEAGNFRVVDRPTVRLIERKT